MKSSQENPMTFIIDGVTTPFASTKHAIIRAAAKRTSFYLAAKELGIRPVKMGRKSLWSADQADAIRDHLIKKSAVGCPSMVLD